jgi:hypothetical protein
MDYLPIQATSVPCERVFSSAKETDTAKRNNINPVLMEALQLLKFSLKKDRLNFMEGWLTKESALHAPEPQPTDDALGSLLKNNTDVGLDSVLGGLITYDRET